MINLMDHHNGKICWNNQVHNLILKFGDIIGFTNLVEKWVYNVVTKLGGRFSLPLI